MESEGGMEREIESGHLRVTTRRQDNHKFDWIRVKRQNKYTRQEILWLNTLRKPLK
jgi:hypothetical protein